MCSPGTWRRARISRPYVGDRRGRAPHTSSPCPPHPAAPKAHPRHTRRALMAHELFLFFLGSFFFLTSPEESAPTCEIQSAILVSRWRALLACAPACNCFGWAPAQLSGAQPRHPQGRRTPGARPPLRNLRRSVLLMPPIGLMSAELPVVLHTRGHGQKHKKGAQGAGPSGSPVPECTD